MAMSSTDLAQLIIERRKHASLSQSAFARLCGVSVGTIGKLETGAARPDTRTLIKLAHGLNTTPEDLLHLYQGLPSMRQPIRRGSLAYRLAQLFRDEEVDWPRLDDATRTLIIELLRHIVILEQLRRQAPEPNGNGG